MALVIGYCALLQVVAHTAFLLSENRNRRFFRVIYEGTCIRKLMEVTLRNFPGILGPPNPQKMHVIKITS